MAVYVGRNPVRVTANQVSAVTTLGGTILTQGDINGGFQVNFQHDNGGCGGAESGIFVAIRDFIPWTWISMDFEVTGSASCWSFMNSSAYGASIGNGGTGNISNFDATQGDKCVKTYLAQNDSPFTTHSNVYACDNNADNFFIYNTGIARKCTFIRRRNVNGSLAGPHHGRSCNTTGSGAVTVIKNIYVWY